MDRTTALLGAALALIVVALLGAVVVPGALADRSDPVRPGFGAVGAVLALLLGSGLYARYQ